MKVLPGPRPKADLKPIRTRALVRRATPILAIAAVIAVQAGADLSPVLAFPLYLIVVLPAALYLSRFDTLVAAALAALGILAPSILRGDRSADAAAALLLAVVLVFVAAAVHEVVGR